jgi:hypothetical protein
MFFARKVEGTSNMPSDDVMIGDRNSLCGLIRTAYVFADPSFQERVWVRGEGPEVSSYVEAVETLDDYRIEHFANDDALKYGFSKDMVEKLRLFTRTAEAFNENLTPTLNDADIIALPEWQAVMTAAAIFVDSAIGWLEQNCEDFPMFKWTWSGRSFGSG